MEILRIPPYPLIASYVVDQPNAVYYFIVRENDSNSIILEDNVISNSASVVNITLTDAFSKYDDEYSIEIYETDINGDIVVEDNLSIVRPYINPNNMGNTASEIAEYRSHERLARAIIDSVTGGFYFNTKDLELVGDGTDYISLWDKAYRILSVYKNGSLVYDITQTPPVLDEYEYFITKDKTAITATPVGYSGDINRAESTPVGLPIAESDSFEVFGENDGTVLAYKRGSFFYKGTDYIFNIEHGYKVVPFDIQEATKMLIEDIKCGKLEYFKRYIVNYSTDQYRIQMDKSSFEGTGNILVDKILDKYITSIKKPGVLWWIAILQIFYFQWGQTYTIQ